MITRFLATLVFALLVSLPVQAREIAGVDVAEQQKLSDGSTLELNGAGIRYKLFFKIYIGMLYLEKKQSDPAAIIGEDSGKRMMMHFLYKEVDKESLVDAWNEGFEANGSPEQLSNLADQIKTFNSMFETVKAGDDIILDYLPGTGTAVSIRGQQKGVVEGKDFNDLLLAIWLGKKPVSEDLRDELLGK